MEPAFHVVVPSLGQVRLSSAAPVRDFGVFQMAQVLNTVMHTLGYSSYSRRRATNLGQVRWRQVNWEHGGGGCADWRCRPAIQSTRLQTLAFGVSDSPHEWVDLRGRDGDFSPAVSTDHFLTNVMVYYISNCITSSFRIYHYHMHRKINSEIYRVKLTVPVAVAMFPYEVVPFKLWAHYWYPKIVQWTIMERGGHLPALERPDDVIQDLRKFATTPVRYCTLLLGLIAALIGVDVDSSGTWTRRCGEKQRSFGLSVPKNGTKPPELRPSSPEDMSSFASLLRPQSPWQCIFGHPPGTSPGPQNVAPRGLAE
ncbi:alpha/beta-hydrolase [Gonapodya prolifera JEL478]|uniref:Alpha/beta-hydrolase n=1 Tax=Gonapodya prolifera (strain JEL478) TaxID=1344416 RepID=A0A139AG97_GONPJ|nr:alpha/beta-hydrolase [Gonapodya prolifera JEL478]|eukprot:KXS15817.1 alpha/beta-hydrolase [Gonapodya prolifera JEL478]